MNARFWNTRNILIIIGITCEIVSSITLLVGTRPSSAICPVTPIIKDIYKLPKSSIRDGAITALKREHEALIAVNDLTRDVAELLLVLGIIVFFVAWRAHRETRSRSEPSRGS
jgi:hypothetical protein